MWFKRGDRAELFHIRGQRIPFLFGSIAERFLAKWRNARTRNVKVTNTSTCKVTVHLLYCCKSPRQVVWCKAIFNLEYMHQSKIPNSISNREPANFSKVTLINMATRGHGKDKSHHFALKRIKTIFHLCQKPLVPCCTTIIKMGLYESKTKCGASFKIQKGRFAVQKWNPCWDFLDSLKGVAFSGKTLV